MEGIVFSNVNEIVKNKEVISEPMTPDHWGVIPYEAADIKGNCLVTVDEGHPGDLILAPNLKGWHKIFLCSWKLDAGYSFLMKLDNEKYFQIYNDASYPSAGQWSRMEYVEESFWKCADLTDRDIIIRKMSRYGYLSPIVWIRCVPMTDEEVAEYKEYINPEGHRNMHVHYDCDTNLFYGVKCPEDAVVKLPGLKNTDTKVCTIECNEVLYDYAGMDDPKARKLTTNSIEYSEGDRAAASMMKEISELRVSMLHEFGIEAYAGLRMSISDGSSPNKAGHVMKFAKEHPEFHMYTRDGRRVCTASYAYKETQDYVIDRFKELALYGYDGVSFLCQRGMHMGFEQPVLDEFARRYDGLDARRVPMDDPRLKEVWCSFFTDFVRRLRKTLDEATGRHVGINVITGYTPEIAKRVGIDVEAMAKEGLIDYITGDCAETYENLDGCLAEDGLIDLEKYKELLGKKYMVSRRHNQVWDLTREGSLQYMEIADKYGIEYFAPHTPHLCRSAEDYIAWHDKLKSIGVKNIAYFNFCHGVQDIPRYHTITKTGHDKVNLEYCRLTPYRVMSMDGCDISTYMPHWLG